MKGNIYEKLDGVFDKFPKHHVKIFLRDFGCKEVREAISNQKLGGRIHTKLVVTMEAKHPKILLSKVQFSSVVTFINLLCHPLMERHIMRSNTF
jgi:hypothetical protein